MSDQPTHILIDGDVFVDQLIYVGHQHSPYSTFEKGTIEVRCPGGAALLHQLVRASLPSPHQVMAGFPNDILGWPCSYAVFDTFPNDPKLSKDKLTWRMRDALGYETPTALAACIDAPTSVPTMVVIDEAAELYRKESARAHWPKVLTDETLPAPTWIILKTQAPIAAGDLWHRLKGDKRNLFKRTVLVLSCKQLRFEQVRVAKEVSWEKTALDLTHEFVSNPRLESLRGCAYVVVTFDTDGALIADFTADEPQFRLLFDPANLEGDWARSIKGQAYGYLTTVTAAITVALATNQGQDTLARLVAGGAAGLAGCRRLLLEGHGAATAPPAFPFLAVATDFANALTSAKPKPLPWTYSATTVFEKNEDWSIAACDSRGSRRMSPLYGLGRRVALNGTSALRGLPFQQFGKLFIVDRGEIESLRGLHQLIDTYHKTTPQEKPLSIAVFGAPGSGKSFGVKQLARAILSDKTPILEFNLSQFDSASELLGLLHQVRDKVLEGLMPVVFWDEFDSKNLYWLQYLLAPMQDGRFQDGQISHPIGKCVFVFAGGTSHDFAGFGPGPGASESALREFRNAKGPDFKSRLNGYLNVLGPNPRQRADGSNDPADVSFPIRRALLLRAKLSKFGAERLAIDRGVLSAFLEIGRYAHGARSMEKILEQAIAAAQPSGNLQRSHLPPKHLLALHVDADEFLCLVERDLAVQFKVEEMAQAYHEFYSDLVKAQTKDANASPAYAALPEHMKNDNREAARRISDVVSLVGLYVVHRDLVPPGISDEDTKEIIEQNIELLAEAEHEGWMEARIRNGWTAGPRDMNHRIHPAIKPYHELDDADKEKDRHAVRHYIEIVARARHRIVMGPPILSPESSAMNHG